MGICRVHTDLCALSLDPIPAAKTDMEHIIVFKEDVTGSIAVVAIGIQNSKTLGSEFFSRLMYRRTGARRIGASPCRIPFSMVAGCNREDKRII
jgi:hypothetical protein